MSFGGTGHYTTGITAGQIPQSAINQGSQQMMQPSSFAPPPGQAFSGQQLGALNSQYGDLMRQSQNAGAVGLQRQMAPQAAQLGLQGQMANANAGLTQQQQLTGLQSENFQAQQPYRSFLYNMLGGMMGGGGF